MACLELHPFNESDELCCGSARYDILYELASGVLPAGLTLDSATGLIYGTSTELDDKAFYFSIKFTITNKLNPADQTILYKDYYIQGVSLKPPRILVNTLPNGYVGYVYDQFIPISGGTAPFNYTVISGSLPYGLSLNSSIPQILGVPVKEGVYNFTFRVTDAYNLYDEVTYHIEILPYRSIVSVFPSTMSDYVIVKDDFHQKHLYSYVPYSVKDIKDA